MLLLKNGKIFTMTQNKVVYGDVLIDNGKILKIDSSIYEPDAEVIDLKNSIVTPGFIDGHCHLGIIESGIGSIGNDSCERSDSINPQLKVENGININDSCFIEACKSGITTVAVCSDDSNVIGGKSCILKTYGDYLEDRIVKSSSTLNISIGDFCKRLSDEKVEMPRSRMAINSIIRTFFIKAKKYFELTKNIKLDRQIYNPKYEAVKSVFEGKTKVEICAHKIQDIQSALRIKKEFGLDMILTYCTEGHMLEKIDSDISVMLGPYLVDKSNYQLVNRNSKSPIIFSNKGINTCLITNHPDVLVTFLPICAAIAVKEGMDYEEALKSITINPAKALGIDDRVGSIEEGKDADLVVFDGDPLKARTKTILTIAEGKIAYRR